MSNEEGFDKLKGLFKFDPLTMGTVINKYKKEVKGVPPSVLKAALLTSVLKKTCFDWSENVDTLLEICKACER